MHNPQTFHPALPAAAPGDASPAEHTARWLQHIAQGRIKTSNCATASLLERGHPGTTQAQMLRHWRNEEVVLGPVAARLVRFGGLERGGGGRG